MDYWSDRQELLQIHSALSCQTSCCARVPNLCTPNPMHLSLKKIQEHGKRAVLVMKAEFHSMTTEKLLLFFSQLGFYFFHNWAVKVSITTALSSLVNGLKFI